MLHNIINDDRLSLFSPTWIFNYIWQYIPDITISMGGYVCEIYSNYGKCKLIHFKFYNIVFKFIIIRSSTCLKSKIVFDKDIQNWRFIYASGMNWRQNGSKHE